MKSIFCLLKENKREIIKTNLKWIRIQINIMIKHIENFSSGKHGLTGLVSVDGYDEPVVYKIPKYLNYMSKHEYTVMKDLESMSDYCRHFCKAVGLINVNLDINYKSRENPFEQSRNMFPQDILLMENITESVKFSYFIKNKEVPEEILYSIIKQVLFAVLMSQKLGFTHYDLHSSNILIKKCDYDDVHVYKLDSENIMTVPTYGYYPVIIDFGFSCSNNTNKSNIQSPLNYTNIGITNYKFDPLSDLKMFLVSLRSEILQRRFEFIDKSFDSMVHNLFSKLDINWDSGWIKYKDNCPVEKISTSIEDLTIKSTLFNECEYSCFDIIQNMIKLPLKSNEVSDLKRGFQLFIKEFIKMEKDLSNNFYRLYLLKCIVDSSNRYGKDYEEGDTSAVKNFKNDIFDGMYKVKKFYDPQCNFESLLCGLMVFANCFEGCLYLESKKQEKWTNKQNEKLEIKKPEHITSIIDYNLKLKYKFNTDTVVKLFDTTNKTSNEFKIDVKYINSLNTCDSLTWGLLLSKIKDNETIDKLITSGENQESPNVIDDIDIDNLSPTTAFSSESDTEYDYDSDFDLS